MSNFCHYFLPLYVSIHLRHRNQIGRAKIIAAILALAKSPRTDGKRYSVRLPRLLSIYSQHYILTYNLSTNSRQKEERDVLEKKGRESFEIRF